MDLSVRVKGKQQSAAGVLVEGACHQDSDGHVLGGPVVGAFKEQVEVKKVQKEKAMTNQYSRIKLWKASRMSH